MKKSKINKTISNIGTRKGHNKVKTTVQTRHHKMMKKTKLLENIHVINE